MSLYNHQLFPGTQHSQATLLHIVMVTVLNVVEMAFTDIQVTRPSLFQPACTNPVSRYNDLSGASPLTSLYFISRRVGVWACHLPEWKEHSSN